MLKRRSLLVPKIETVKGTLESPTVATDGAMNIYDAKWRLANSGKEKRPNQVNFFKLASVPKGKAVTITFSTDLVGKGATGQPIWATTLLAMCGYNNVSGTFGPCTPDVSAQQTGSIYLYIDGKKFSFAGCMGNFKITITNGSKGMVEFEMTGKLAATPADVALPSAPTFPTTSPPVGAASCTYGSYTPGTDKVVFDAGNTVVLLPTVVNDGNNTGFAYAVVSDANPTIDISPREDLVANQDWDAAWASSSLATFAFVVGTAANNIWTFAGSNCEVADPGGNDDTDGVVTRGVKLDVNGGATLIAT